MSVDEILRDILSRRDPHGYYVIPALAEAADEFEKLGIDGVKIDFAGDTVFIKVRSRNAVSKIVRHLARLNLLAISGEREG